MLRGIKFLCLVVVLTGIILSGIFSLDIVYAGSTVNGSTGLFTVYTTDTLYKGNVAFSLYYNNLDRDPLDWDLTYYHMSFSTGITDRLEFSVSIPFVQREGDAAKQRPDLGSFFREGMGDTIISAKYDFVTRDGDPFDVALRGFVGLPSGEEDDGLGRGELFLGGDVIIDRDFGPIGTHFNVGLNIARQPEPVSLGDVVTISDEFTYGIGLNFPTSSRFQGIIELTGVDYFDDDNDQENPLDLTLGFRLTAGSFEIGAGVKTNLQMDNDNEENPFGAIVELSYYETEKRTEVSEQPAARPSKGLNHPPTVKIVAPDTVIACEKAKIHAKGSDPDGDILTYSWDISHGKIAGSGPDVTWKSPCGEPLVVSVTVTVDDGNGATASDSAKIIVVIPPPSVESVVFDPVHFDFDSARLTNIAKAILDDIALTLKRDTRIDVSIEGHTCSIGTNKYNMKLGKRRAMAVYRYLVDKHGISPDRLEVKSFGEEKPIAPNNTRQGRKKNRRVELIVPY